MKQSPVSETVRLFFYVLPQISRTVKKRMVKSLWSNLTHIDIHKCIFGPLCKFNAGAIVRVTEITSKLTSNIKHLQPFTRICLSLRRPFWNTFWTLLLPGALVFHKHISFKNWFTQYIYCGWLYFRGYQFSLIGQKLHILIIHGIQNSWIWFSFIMYTENCFCGYSSSL